MYLLVVIVVRHFRSLFDCVRCVACGDSRAAGHDTHYLACQRDIPLFGLRIVHWFSTSAVMPPSPRTSKNRIIRFPVISLIPLVIESRLLALEIERLQGSMSFDSKDGGSCGRSRGFPRLTSYHHRPVLESKTSIHVRLRASSPTCG